MLLMHRYPCPRFKTHLIWIWVPEKPSSSHGGREHSKHVPVHISRIGIHEYLSQSSSYVYKQAFFLMFCSFIILSIAHHFLPKIFSYVFLKPLCKLSYTNYSLKMAYCTNVPKIFSKVIEKVPFLCSHA